MYIDSHCHLSFPELHGRLAEIRAAMAEAGVDRALCICTTLEEFDAACMRWRPRTTTSGAASACIPTTKTSPNPTVDDLLALAALPRGGRHRRDRARLLPARAAAASPTWTGSGSASGVHISAARRARLPLVIHTRSASDDTLAILREEGGGRATRRVPLLHRDRGGGPRRAGSGLPHLVLRHPDLQDRRRSCATWRAFVPLDRCLIETDSPYLAPVPLSRQDQRPRYVPCVARQLAELKGVAGGGGGRGHEPQFRDAVLANRERADAANFSEFTLSSSRNVLMSKLEIINVIPEKHVLSYCL